MENAITKIGWILIGIIVVYAGWQFLAGRGIVGESIEDKAAKTSATVDVSKIQSGGPPKDGIPSIDDPQFVTVDESEFLDENGLGLAISHKGVDRFYPYQIIVWHEIVNDTIDGDPILITYCPLCGTGIAFERSLDGEAVEFGVSGKLLNSNLIMYDRQSDTYWQQATGEAIVGEKAGEKLTLFPASNVTWGEWKGDHPDGQVLSRDTGSVRDYTRSPYGDYANNDDVFFPVDNLADDRLDRKARIYGVELDGVARAYPLDTLKEGASDDQIGEIAVEVNYAKSSGRISVTNAQSGQEIPGSFSFWFSWASFYPETSLWPD